MKTLIKKALRRIGLELTRYTPETSAASRLHRMFSYHGIDLVFDVGANIGQYAGFLREIGYRGRIVSFEPLTAAYTKLVSLSKKDPMWEIAPRTAIGDRNGEIKINISRNSYSSSVLNMLDSHLNAAPDSVYVGSEVVGLSRLDSIAAQYLEGADSAYLKIDVQGFEMQVLEGAAGILPGIKGVQMELSLAPMYEGETLFKAMLGKMELLGYEIHAIIPGFTDAETGRLLQVDGVFFRR